LLLCSRKRIQMGEDSDLSPALSFVGLRRRVSERIDQRTRGGAYMDPGEQTTGTRDEHYDLVSVLYHALQGADTCNVYALDAEAAGDERLAAFFREASVVQTQLAERAKGMLGITDVPPEGMVAPEPLPGNAAGGISPGDISGGMPPGAPPGEAPGGGPSIG
jgi:hypothetical protein